MQGGRPAVQAAQAALTLLRFPICPFCCATRSYLDYHRIPFLAHNVNPVSKKELHAHPAIVDAKARGASFKSVPVAVMRDGDVVQGSLDIINQLDAKGMDATPTTPRTTDTDETIQWAYDNLVKLFPVNIYRSPREAWEVFAYIADEPLSFMDKAKVRVGGAAMMWGVANTVMRRRLNGRDARSALYLACDEWLSRGAFDRSRGEDAQFHGGSVPDLADVVVYGMFSSMRGMRTLADVRLNVDGWDAWFTAMQHRMADAEVKPQG